MHVKILIKIRALNSSDAKEVVEEALNESVHEGNSTGWDYVGGIKQIVKTVTDESKISLGNFKSFKELEKHWHNSTLKNMRNYERQIEDELFLKLAKKYMPQKEVPLYLDRKNYYGNETRGLPEIIQKKLKSKTSEIKLPQTYEKMIQIFSSEIIKEAKNTVGMVLYYLKEIHKIQSHLDYPEDREYSLQSTNIHFADFSADEEIEGEETYYFLCDRHC